MEDPKNPNCYLANIECDGPGWAGARTVRERERLRKDVLKNMGWKSCRLWSSEWIRNPEAEGRKLLAFLKNAEEEKNA